MNKLIQKVFNKLGYEVHAKGTLDKVKSNLANAEGIIKEQDFLNGNSIRSFSWEGEDVLIERIINNNFKDKQTGFYVDVGAHHPLQLSNTYRLYLRGWRGINIDAAPGSMKAFEQYRPEDINLELGIANDTETMNFYIFEDKGLNGFLDDQAIQDKLDRGQKGPLDKIAIQRMPLSMVLDKHSWENKPNIDLLNVDAETLDYEVLQSSNWYKYKPTIIVVEDFHRGFESKSRINIFLESKGYKLRSKLYFSTIYIRKELPF